MKVFRGVIAVAKNPWVMMAAGFFLSLASAIELGEQLFGMAEGIKGEHGTFLYGLMVTLRSMGEVGELDEGIGLLGEGRNKAAEGHESAE